MRVAAMIRRKAKRRCGRGSIIKDAEQPRTLGTPLQHLPRGPVHLPLLLAVVVPVACVALNVAILFERENGGNDAIEKETIVRDHENAARPALDELGKRTERREVEIVGRLVEKE